MDSTIHLTQFNVTDPDGIESDDCRFDASKFNATGIPLFIALHISCFIVAIVIPMLYFRRFRKQPLAEIAAAIEKRATFAPTFQHLNKKKKYMYGNTLVSSDHFAFNVDTAGSVESVHLLDDADFDCEHTHAFPARQQSSLDEVIGAFRAFGIGNEIVHLILVEYCGFADASDLAVISQQHHRLMRRQYCSYICIVIVVAVVAAGPYVWALYGAIFLIPYGWCSGWGPFLIFVVGGVLLLGQPVLICMEDIDASSLRRFNEEYRNEIVEELRERDIALYAQATTECDTVKADLAKVKTQWLCRL